MLQPSWFLVFGYFLFYFVVIAPLCLVSTSLSTSCSPVFLAFCLPPNPHLSHISLVGPVLSFSPPAPHQLIGLVCIKACVVPSLLAGLSVLFPNVSLPYPRVPAYDWYFFSSLSCPPPPASCVPLSPAFVFLDYSLLN